MFYLLTLFTCVVTVSFYKNQPTWIIRPKDIHFNSRTLVSQVIHRGSATQKSLRALIHSLINPSILCPIQNIVKFELYSILYFTIIDDAFSRLTIRLHICLHRNQINRDFALDHVTVNLFLDSSTAIGKAHQCVYSRSSKQIVYGVETLEEKTVAENKIFSPTVSSPSCVCSIHNYDHDTSGIKAVELEGGRNSNGFPNMEVQHCIQLKAGPSFCSFHEKGHEVD